MSDRAPSTSLFVNTATVANQTASAESGTNARKITATVTASVSCSIQPKGSDVALRWGRLETESVAQGYFPNGTTISAGALVTQTDKTPNTVYRVIGVGRAGAGRTSYITAQLLTEAIANV